MKYPALNLSASRFFASIALVGIGIRDAILHPCLVSRTERV
jgi:hypothetical protein